MQTPVNNQATTLPAMPLKNLRESQLLSMPASEALMDAGPFESRRFNL